MIKKFVLVVQKNGFIYHILTSRIVHKTIPFFVQKHNSYTSFYAVQHMYTVYG